MTWANSSVAQLLRMMGESEVCASNQLYHDHNKVAISISTSPATKRKAASCRQSPWANTTMTPTMDSKAPNNCHRWTDALKNKEPIIIIQMGMLAPTKVTLTGLDVCKARY